MPRLLIVDDDEHLRNQFSEYFAMEDWQVSKAGTGSEALQLLDSSFDAVLLDLEMPDMDGLSTLREIRNDHELDGTCVVLLTGYGTVLSAVHSIRLGAYQYIDKASHDYMNNGALPALRDVLLAGIAKQKINAMRRELLGSLQPDRLLEKIWSVFHKTIRPQGLYLILADKNGRIEELKPVPGGTNEIPALIQSANVDRGFIRAIRAKKECVFAAGADAVSLLDPILPATKCLLATFVPGRNGEIAGYIDMESDDPNAFDEGWEDVLTYSADLTGIAMELAETTEQKLLFQQLRQMPALVQDLSHQLSSPLQHLTNQVDWLLEEDLRGKGLDETVVSNLTGRLQVIKQRSFSMADVVRQLQDISKDIEPRCDLLRLDVLLEGILDKYRTDPRNSAIDVSLSVQDLPPEGIQVKGDEHLVRYVIECLVDNALESVQEARLKSTRTREVRGETSKAIPDRVLVEVTVDTARSRVVVAVMDTGLGVSDEDRDKLFRPLFTTKSPVRTRRGIGLFSARRYAVRQGGTVEFLPQRSSGATFTFSLPLAKLQGAMRATAG